MSDNHSSKAYRRRLTPIERFFTRSPFAIVTMVARIRGSVTESMVRDAVAKVRQRHPNLSARIIEDEDGTPWLTSEGAGEITVATVPRESDDHWLRVAQESSQIPSSSQHGRRCASSWCSPPARPSWSSYAITSFAMGCRWPIWHATCWCTSEIRLEK